MSGRATIRLLVAASLLLVLGAAAPAASPQTAEFDWFVYRGSDPVDETLLPDPGAYRNPILQGFYPDPSIVRAGRFFYLVTSTFGWFPAIPVFRSADLVHWTQIGNAIDRPDQLDFGRLGLSRGVFAPSIAERDGLFYILNTCVDCGGNFLITARDPRGPWSDPVWLPDLEGGIDPSLFFDSNGSAWIVNNGPPPGKSLYEGHRAIWIQRFDSVRRKTFGPRSLLVNGGVDPAKKPVWIEGPRLFQRGGFHYLICAEGGTAEGHSEVVLRSKAVTGPYVAFAGNPILTQRDLPPNRPLPITSAGHAGFVEISNGSWWATFLAVRPYAGDFYNTGRETFLLPVRWHDGWPQITAPGEAIVFAHARPRLPKAPAGPIPTSGPFTIRDDFDERRLPAYWMMMRNPRDHWYRLSRGRLRLKARAASLSDMGNPSFLARRQQHSRVSVSTRMRFTPRGDGDQAGLVALQNDDYWFLIGITRRGGREIVELRRRVRGDETVLASAPFDGGAGGPLDLRIDANGGTYDFFYAVRNGGWRQLGGDQDGTILSTKVAGGFVGAMFGLYAHAAP